MDDAEYVEYVRGRLPALRRLAFLLCGHESRADDLVQQTITNLYVSWTKARAARNIDAYVRTMLVRSFIDERRLAWARVRLFGAVPEPPPPPVTDDVEDRAVLREALARVPKRQRAVLVLRFLQDLPVDEVAEIPGCSPGTEKKLAARGQAQAINEAGTIVGSEGGLVPNQRKPVRWATADSAPEPLPMPPGFSSGTAVDIDQDGTIVGMLDRDNQQVPYVWFPAGTHRELAAPGTTRFGMVAGIRNGWVVGDLRPAGNAARVQMRWNVNTGGDTVLDDLVDGGAHAVNAHGWVTGQHTSGNAVMITPTGYVQLPGLPGVTGFLYATWLSDDGRTAVGSAMNTSGNMRPIRWRCS